MRRQVISSAGFDVWTFDRPITLLNSELQKAGACMVADIDLLEMKRVKLRESLAASGCRLPIILITAHTDEETGAVASKSDPAALLFKPFGRDLFVNSIRKVLFADQ